MSCVLSTHHSSVSAHGKESSAQIRPESTRFVWGDGVSIPRSSRSSVMWVPSMICRMTPYVGVLSTRLAIGPRQWTEAMASDCNGMVGIVFAAASCAVGATEVCERCIQRGGSISRRSRVYKTL